MPEPPPELLRPTPYPAPLPPLALDPERPDWVAISIFLRSVDNAYVACRYTHDDLVAWFRRTKTIVDTPPALPAPNMKKNE